MRFGALRRAGRTAITSETYTLIGLGLAAIVVFWLVYSVFRRLFGLVLIIALAVGAWVVWSNPQLLQSVMDMAANLLGGRL